MPKSKCCRREKQNSSDEKKKNLPKPSEMCDNRSDQTTIFSHRKPEQGGFSHEERKDHTEGKQDEAGRVSIVVLAGTGDTAFFPEVV